MNIPLNLSFFYFKKDIMAVTGVASTRIVLEVLTKDNYNTLVESYLVAHGLWLGIAVGDAKVHRDKSRGRSQNGKVACDSTRVWVQESWQDKAIQDSKRSLESLEGLI